MSGQNNALLLPPQPVSFTVEHFDPVARVTNTYVLTYFPDGRLQMVYTKIRKAFLSKTYMKEISPVDLFVGNTIVVCSRHLSIVGYANESTRRYFESRQTRAFVLVQLPPATTEKEETIALGEIVTALQHGDDSGGEERQMVLGNRSPPSVITKAEMFRCCGHMGHRGRPEALASWMEDVFPLRQASRSPDKNILRYLSTKPFNRETGNVVALEILVNLTNGGFQGLLGVIDRLRRKYSGKSIFASSSPHEAAEHVRYVFDERGLTPPEPSAAIMRGLDWNNTDGSDRACTLCVVKPHVIRQGGLGVVLSLIAQHGFKVTRLQMLSLTDAEADELLLPYRGVISYHREALRHLKSGPCVALKIEGGSNVVEEFREACGPADPEVAKELRPHSIRAILGDQQVTNAVHCTDLPDDGLLECRFMFDIIASSRHF